MELTPIRVQEECEPRDDASNDEDGYVTRTAKLVTILKLTFASGHVEKTNDRDYEAEER